MDSGHETIQSSLSVIIDSMASFSCLSSWSAKIESIELDAPVFVVHLRLAEKPDSNIFAFLINKGQVPGKSSLPCRRLIVANQWPLQSSKLSIFLICYKK